MPDVASCLYHTSSLPGEHHVVTVHSVRPDVFEPIWSTVFLEEESLSIREATRLASSAFGRVRAVEVRDMLVADISEPGGLISFTNLWNETVLSENVEGLCEMKKTHQWILLLSSNSPSAMLCTGASPHRS